MNLLIVAATKLEIKPFLKKLNYLKDDWTNFTSLDYNNHQLDVLITGVGLVFTTYHLSKALCAKKKYDLVINAGIAGSFNKEIEIGEVVNVVQEEFADLGVEGTKRFKTLFELGFADEDSYPFKEGRLIAKHFDNKSLSEVRKVTGISSNTAHGKLESIDFLKEKYKADIETMEGAASFYVCMLENVDIIQIRAISNYVEPRNKDGWDIPLALDNLSDVVIGLIKTLNLNVKSIK
jgi:futalosine hydrolase